ncbi:MAG: glycerophosphodiester phosphodiesterase family protein [Mucilaginibacter sp.]|uniref:glycerophosphodiester phosphodiesterase n=1 Tax=Mucilaginibacter sp. TaxID=1882438 RepID=UPI0031AB3766
MIDLIYCLFLSLIIVIPVINLMACKTSGIVRSKFILTGHRGAGGIAPENTIAAIDSGIAEHADWVEIDIRQTKDGHIVVMHDETINRTTNGKGKVQELTLAGIRSFNVTGFKVGDVAFAKVPLLTEVIEKVKSANVKLLIEIKYPESYPGMVEQLISILEAEPDLSKFMVFSFDRKCLVQVKKALPGITTGVFCLGYEGLGKFDDLGISYICPFWPSLLYRPGLVAAIHNKKLKILVWTVDHAWAMRYVIGKSVDGLITNRPDVFNSIELNK